MAWRSDPARGSRPAGGIAPAARTPGPVASIKPSSSVTGSRTLTPNISSKPTTAPIGGSAIGKKAVLTVTSNAKKDEIGVQTLIGDYEEYGDNHGRKYYKKVQEIPGHKDVKVFLYYWDMRDGNDFAGWWFGDELGGSQVWARCSSHGNMPPAAGWKIPWDAMKSEPGLLTVSPYKGGSTGNQSGTPAKSDGRPGAFKPSGLAPAKVEPSAASGKGAEDRVKKATKEVEKAESAAKPLIAKAKAAKEDMSTDDLTEIQESLLAQQKQLSELQKTLTQEINEARKGGPSAVTSVTELSKLSPRLRAVVAGTSGELNKIRGWISNVSRKQDQVKKDAVSQQKQKELEEKDSKELEEALPVVKETVGIAEDAVEAVNIMAAPMINDPPDDAGDHLKKILDEIEVAANDAQSKLTEAKQTINTKLQAARQFAPEARKTALAEFTTLQGQLSDAQKKLNPLKSFKREFAQRAEAKKALVEFAEQISNAELEVEKAAMMTTGADSGSQMSEEDVTAAEELVTPAQKALADVSKQLEVKMRGASGPMKDELTAMKEKIAESKTKVDKVSVTLKSQREGLTLQSVYTTAQAKVDKAEETFAKCGEAELPFLKGIEVLPHDESDNAIKESETAAAESSSAVRAADNFLKTKLSEIKRYSKETAAKATEELTELQKRVEAVKKKLESFKGETQERKVTAMMAEVVDTITVAETKSKALSDAGALFSSENLDDTSVEMLKEATEKTAAAEKESSAALSEAKKALNAKSKVAKDKQLVEGLNKLSKRISAVQQEMSKVKKATANGGLIVRGKEVAADAETKLGEIEGEVEKLVKMSKPDDDGLGVEKITDANIIEMDTMSASVAKSLKSVNSSLASHLPTAPAAIKASLTKLSDRCKAAQTKVDDVKASTKEQRERVLSESFVNEGKKKTEEVESAMLKLEEAELPYLKGVEVLPLEEAKTSLVACEEAIAMVQSVISTARSFIAEKNLEIKKFEAKNGKASLEEFEKLTSRVNSIAQKLGVSKKDSEMRRKKALLQEAVVKIEELEKEVEKVSEAMKPMMERNPDEMSSEEAASLVKKLEELEESAQQKVSDCRSALAARSRDAKDDSEKAAQISELKTKLTAAQTELSKAKKLGSTHADKIKSKALIQEAGEKLKEVEALLEKAKSASAPLTEEKGERFLIKASLSTLATACLNEIGEKDLKEEDMLQMMGSPLNQSSFVEFVGKIPELWKREEVFFPEERRVAMFKNVDADGDGVINIDEFKAMLAKRYLCVHAIAVTDLFEIGNSKTVCKLEQKDVVEAIGAAKAGEKEGSMPRLKIRITSGASSGQEGWVTLQGNSGTKYLEPISAFKAFSQDLTATLKDIAESIEKVTGYFIARQKELGAAGKDSPLIAAKEAISKTRSKVSAIVTSLDSLKKDTEKCKREYAATAEKEKNAHVEVKEQKEADAVLAAAKPAMTTMEAELKKLDDLTKPLFEKQGSGSVLAFATPLTVQEEIKALEKVVRAAAAEAKALVKTQRDLVEKATKGAMLEAKKELNNWTKEVAKADSACKKAISGVRNCCNIIAKATHDKIAAALRSEVKTKGISLDEYFNKLSADADKITEDAFCSHAQGLEGLEIPLEHAKLMARQIEVDGISRRSFLRFIQQYYLVVKEIAITPSFDIVNSKDKPVRKAEVDEIVEVTEGPTKDEKSGLERVRVKALSDGAEGWISIKGNQGKVFLEEADKPFLSCLKEISLEKEFVSGSEDIRKLKADEVLEVVEGPRKESVGTALRVRGKATQDGKVGWVTMKDKNGNELMEKGSKSYTCTATVAVTDAFDIKSCKVLKKLAVDEVFVISDGPIKEESSGIQRVRGKSSKDGVEGWVTICGNAGTVYAKVNDKLFTVKKEVSLTKQFSSESTEIRTLAVDEAFEGMEAPKEEKTTPIERVRVRTSADSTVGWITVRADNVQKWLSSYKFLKAAPVYAAKGVRESIVREIAVGEKAEVLEGPLDVDGNMWIKCSLKKENTIGWTPMKDESGARLLGQ